MFRKTMIPWTIFDIIIAIILRIAGLYVFVRFLYAFGLGNPLLNELTDRVVMVAAVLAIVFLRYRGSWNQLRFGTSSLGNSMIWGVGGALVLWIAAHMTDLFMVRVLLQEGVDNPLIEQVRGFTGWGQLIVPLTLAGIITPVGEEIFYRGLIFQTMKARWGLLLGAIVSGLLFAVFHFQWFFLLELTVLGILLALLLQFSNSMLACIIAHSLVNSGRIILTFLGR